MDKWKRQDINNLDFKELCESFYYYKRKMGYGPAAIEEYDANVFICIFKDKEQLISNWEKINYMIAFRVQKRSEIIIEKSNFYFCLFVNESIGSDNKSRIQGNSFCAKKYIFEEKLMNEKEYLERVDARIFSLEIEKTVGETFKINRIELQNFRRYEGNLKIDLTGKNKKPSAFTLIYAPNGYGKTSLFDGLEYAFKGEVERIVDLIKSNKDQPLKGAIYHNKNCADKPAYSQIELEDGRIIKRNVASIKDGKNDSRLNQLGKNSGLNIIGSTMDKEKWNRIILPHDKIDTFISAYTPTERYKEWMKSAPELEAERENFIESYKALRDKEISLEKIEKEIKELKKELTKIEKSKVAVIQLGKLCEEYNALAKSEDSLFFNETKSSLEIYNNLLNKIAKRMFFSKKENEQVKRLDQLIIYEREKNNKEIQLGNLEIEIDSLRKKIQLNEEWLENQDIILNEYSMEEWEMWLENKKVECRKLQLQKDELKKKIEELHTIRQNNKAHVEIKSKQKESIIDNSKLYSMILFLMEKPDEFDVGFERNSLKTSIELLRTEEKKKRNDLMKYKECGQIDEMDIKQKVSECDTEIANLQELKKQACIFENFSPEGMEKSINTWEKEKKNYEAQLELLYEMREENGARTYFEKYTAICKKIENQNKNLENKVLQIRKVKKSYEIEKNTLEMKLKDYFSQTIMNEIYQKIDPHEIMKNVTYHLNFNEKDEPQLFIEVCEGEESSKEVYRPETYFSTAQLNTVAFSSFFGRALSTNNLPVKTICIDDPIGHFDDMNILGFTDMVRCILEKQDCQIIMSTHEEKVYQIMKRKLDPNFYNTLFIQLDNSEKVIWNRANC